MDSLERKKQGQVWLGIFFSLICLAAIFFFIKPADLLEALQKARYEYLLLTTIGILLFLVFRAIRWRFMLNNEAPFGQVFHIQNIGYMLTMLLPLRLGDVARAILIGNVPPVTLARGISTMVVERILDMIFMVIIVPFTLAEVEAIPPELSEVVRLFGIAAVGGILVLIVAANKRPLANRVATSIFDRLPFLDTAAWVRRVDDLLAGLSSLTRLRDGLILSCPQHSGLASHHFFISHDSVSRQFTAHFVHDAVDDGRRRFQHCRTIFTGPNWRLSRRSNLCAYRSAKPTWSRSPYFCRALPRS